jgi:hypothetical protein
MTQARPKPHNRIAKQLQNLATPAPQAVYSNAIFAAIQAVQQLFTHDDPQVVLKAASMILDLEKTRLRHAGSDRRDLCDFAEMPAPTTSPDPRATALRNP